MHRAIEVRNQSQRNRGFSVTWSDTNSRDKNQNGYYVKQHQPEGGIWETRSSIATEAHMLQFFSENIKQRRTPLFKLFDRERQALVIEWKGNSQPIQHELLHNNLPIPSIARQLGVELALLHLDLASAELPVKTIKMLSSSPPWILTIDRLYPLASADQSWGQAKLVALVQSQYTLMEVLAGLTSSWPYTQLIHGDMKWQNCLFHANENPHSPSKNIVFIDWEMASWGDPLWDMAGLAQAYIKHWLEHWPQDNNKNVTADITFTSSGDMIRQFTNSTYHATQQAITQLWRGYQEYGGAGADNIRFASLLGARLIQTIYEDLTGESELQSRHMIALQLAYNLLLKPGQSAPHIVANN